jgi:hypothetical protein
MTSKRSVEERLDALEGDEDDTEVIDNLAEAIAVAKDDEDDLDEYRVEPSFGETVVNSLGDDGGDA